jgi:hypothetical protein
MTLTAKFQYEVKGHFEGKHGSVTADLSGVALMPARADGSRLCLFINDESRAAQFAMLNGRTIIPGDTLKLVHKSLPDDIAGAPPPTDCPGEENPEGEFDGEAVAYAEPYFYVVGSHGCARKTGKFNPASFLLARVRVTVDGVPAGEEGEALAEEDWSEAVELTYRLSDALRGAEAVGGFFGKSLPEENGLNIEGLAVDGGRLLVGLRAPSIDGEAFIVAVAPDDLFAPGEQPAEIAAEVIPLKLGEDMGIRDLTSLPDGRLLVLAGPAQDQELAYRLFLAEPRAGGALTELGELEPVPGEDGEAKAEGLAVLGVQGGEAEVLVLFDGAENGNPLGLMLQLP